MSFEPKDDPTLPWTTKVTNACPGMPFHQADLIGRREVTQAQAKFTQQVIEFLKTIKYTGTIEVETLLVLSEKTTDRQGNESEVFRIRFADILLPEIGLAIEVDGRSHDEFDWKINFDNAREEFFLQIGCLPPYRLDNEDALIPQRSTRNCKELCVLILELRKQILSCRRSPYTTLRCLAKGRNAFYRAYPGLAKVYPSLRTDIAQDGIWKKYHMGKRARFNEGRLIQSRRRPKIKKEQEMGVNGMSPRKRGRPSKMQKDQIALRVEEMKKQNPARTLDSIASELGYSSRQLRRIRSANLMAKLKMVAWT